MHRITSKLSLRAGIDLAGFSVEQIWGRCICLGGDISTADIAAQINNTAASNPPQHDLIAHALNEYLNDCGLGWPVAYAVPDGWATGLY